jgi:hypothetical protein
MDITSAMYIFLRYSDRNCLGTELSQDARVGTQMLGLKCRDKNVVRRMVVDSSSTNKLFDILNLNSLYT